MAWTDTVRGWFRRDKAEIPTVNISALQTAPPVRWVPNDGEKYPGGFGLTKVYSTDYWMLRTRSSQLFEDNIYARGLIRRLVTNEINTGLHLEAMPEASLLGLSDDDVVEWTESTENKLRIWGDDPKLCDHVERMTFGELQAIARCEALVAGDILVVLLQDKKTSLPRVQLINADAVRTPPEVGPTGKVANGNMVVHGVEIDKNGRHVAYWIRKPEMLGIGKSERLPAFGARTGRRVAWLLYGTDKRMDEVRGKPLLALVLQSLNEIDKYRDAAQRKAVINSMLAMFVTKGEDKPGTRPLAGGAQRVGTDTAADSSGTPRTFNFTEQIPGGVIDELQQGEVPKGFPPTGTDEKFGDFEEAIIVAIAWSNEIPPEILRLSFGTNYAASQAAINEFKIYLNRVRTTFGKQFCQPIYVDWLISQTLEQRIDAPGFIEAWRDPSAYEVFGAWVTADWTGHIKPAVDMSKLVKGYTEMVEQGFISRDRATRELTGTKYSKNVKKLARENPDLAAANEALAKLDKPDPPVVEGVIDDLDEDEKEGMATDGVVARTRISA